MCKERNLSPHSDLSYSLHPVLSICQELSILMSVLMFLEGSVRLPAISTVNNSLFY